MRLDLYFQKEGVHPLDVSREADETYALDIPAGTYNWQSLSIPVVIPAGKIVCVGVWIEGEGYEGDIWFERPFLTSSTGWNLLPDFMPPVPGKQKFDWSAQNLSRKEWPEFRVSLNGKVIIEDEQFERCHRRSEWSVSIPRDVLKPDKNILSIDLISAYRDPLPYTIHELSLVARPDAALTIISVPDQAPAYGVAYVLIRTTEPNTCVEFESADGLSPCSPLEFEHAGLNTLALRCGGPALNACFTLRFDGCVVKGVIARIVEKSDDGIVTGTGDLIYIRQDKEMFEEYLSWYMANNVGNMLTIRPTYRWSGSRTLKAAVWKYATHILNGMGMKYAHMVDGRELPGLSGNPTGRMLAGPGFLGRQNHEHDGALFYWGPHTSYGSLTVAQYYAMEQRIFREAPEQTHTSCAPPNYFSDASYEQAIEGINSGIRGATHLMNGMKPMHHLESSLVVAALLNDDVTVEIIADGFHLRPETVKLIFRLKPIEKIILVTDSVWISGLEKGQYSLNGVRVINEGGRLVVDEGGAFSLAGSCLSLDQALRNAVEFSGMSVESILKSVTENPAVYVGCDKRKGKLCEGFDADINILSGSLHIEKTIVKGRLQ